MLNLRLSFDQTTTSEPATTTGSGGGGGGTSCQVTVSYFCPSAKCGQALTSVDGTSFQSNGCTADNQCDDKCKWFSNSYPAPDGVGVCKQDTEDFKLVFFSRGVNNASTDSGLKFYVVKGADYCGGYYE